MLKINIAKTAIANIIDLLNTKSKRPIVADEFTFGNPATVTPGGGNGNNNTSLLCTYAGGAGVAGDTTVFYNRNTLAENSPSAGSLVEIDSTDTFGSVQTKTSLALSLVQSEISFTNPGALPSPNNEVVMAIAPIANSLLYRGGSFNVTLRNTDDSEVPDAQFYLQTFGTRADGDNNQGNNTTYLNLADSVAMTPSGTALTMFQGAASPTGPQPWTWWFNGTNATTSFPGSADFVCAGNLTIEFWFKRVAGTGVADIIGNYVANTGSDWIVLLNTGNVIQFYPHGSTAGTFISGGSIDLDKWYHVACVRSGTTCSLYVNGSLRGTVSKTGNFGHSTQAVRIGSRGGSTNFFQGMISNLRFLNGTALYTAEFTPPDTQLTAITNTKLLVCNRPNIINDATNPLVFTTSGDLRTYSGGPMKGTTEIYDPAVHGGVGVFNSTNMAGSNADLGAIGTGDFTVEGWVRLETTNTVYSIFSSYTTATGEGILLGFEASRRPLVAVGNHGSRVVIAAANGLPQNVWVHVAATRQSGTLRLFVDGVLANTVAGATRNINRSDFNIGTYYQNNTTNNLIGQLSGVRVVSGTALYTANFVPSKTAPTAVSGTKVLAKFHKPGFFDVTCRNNFFLRGGALLSDAQRKFGPTALLCDNSAAKYAESTPNPLNRNSPNNDLTIEAWIRPTNVADAEQGVVACGDGGSSYAANVNWVLAINGSEVKFYYSNGSGGVFVQTSGAALTSAAWHHVAVVFTASTKNLDIYVNGTRVHSTTLAAFGAPQQIPRIAVGGPCAGYNAVNEFNGYIDDVRITDFKRYIGSSITVPNLPFPAM